MKFSLAAVIESPDFIDLVKNYFMRILAYKVQKMLSQGQKFRKIITGSLNDEEIVSS